MILHRRSLLLGLTGCFLLSAPAAAGPILDALASKRFTDAIAMSSNGDPVVFAYTRWATLSQPGGHTFLTFSDAVDFLRKHRNWPLENRIRISVEAAQLRDNTMGGDAQWMCDALKPISGRGMVACANLLPQTDGRVAPMIRQAWLQGDFDAPEERDVLARYGHMLKPTDHAARVERLLFEGKVAPAQRTLGKLSAASRAIAETRIALIGGAKNADAKLASLPASARTAPGIIYDRIRYRHRKKLYDGALELFASSPANPPYSDAWWTLRHYYAREAMASKQYSKALTIVRKSGNMDNIEFMAEALWLSGWLRYEHLNDARAAYTDFTALYALVKTPVSKSRAAYWAARAAERTGNRTEAQEWLTKAAKYPTVFYGQLAQARLHPGQALRLPSSVDDVVFSNPLMKVAEMLEAAGNAPQARIFWEQAAANTHNAANLAGIAARAEKVHRGNAVRVAKASLRQNIILLKQGWPVIRVPAQSPIEQALTLAIARQESEFDPTAVSSANARGLMQVLPGTATHTVKAFGLPYSASDLYSPDANLTIGSAYLSELIGKARGSYPVAIASYNAGPGAALRWVAQNGRPGQSVDATLRWIESIPYGETRNYVQRVLENLQVYRELTHPGTPLGIERDLMR